MKNKPTRSGIILAWAMTALLSTTVAAEESAASTDPAPSAAVATADLDLRSAAGRGVLSSRIRMAADRICLTSNVEPLKVRMARAKCFQTVLASQHAQAFTSAGTEGAPSTHTYAVFRSTYPAGRQFRQTGR